MTILKAEFLKIKRVWGLYICYMFPVIITVLSTFEILKKVHSTNTINSISPLSSFYFQFFTTFSPIAILLIVFSLIQVENKNKMWESTVLLPVSKTKLYVSKHITGIFVVFVYMTLSYILYIISSEVLSQIFPQLSGLTLSDHAVLMNFFLRMFLVFILYTVIAIPIFIYVDSAIIALGILMFGILLSLFLTQQKWYAYYPFSYHITVFNTFKSHYEVLKDKSFLMVMVYVVLSFIAGLYSFINLKTSKF